MRPYLLVFAALLVLTATTVAVSKVDLGPFNVVVAMSIATMKASLVLWFFMHLRQATSVVRLAAAAALLWMLILLAFTLSDYVTRGWNATPPWWK